MRPLYGALDKRVVGTRRGFDVNVRDQIESVLATGLGEDDTVSFYLILIKGVAMYHEGEEIREIIKIKEDLNDSEKASFDALYTIQRRDPDTALSLSIFGGIFAMDRFYINSSRTAAVLKLLTCGGILVWVIIDYFLIRGAARRQNRKIMRQIHDLLVIART